MDRPLPAMRSATQAADARTSAAEVATAQSEPSVCGNGRRRATTLFAGARPHVAQLSSPAQATCRQWNRTRAWSRAFSSSSSFLARSVSSAARSASTRACSAAALAAVSRRCASSTGSSGFASSACGGADSWSTLRFPSLTTSAAAAPRCSRTVDRASFIRARSEVFSSTGFFAVAILPVLSPLVDAYRYKHGEQGRLLVD